MKRLIEDALIKCGMPVSVAGFNFIVEAVLVLLNEPNIKITALYTVVANKMNTTHEKVERSIRHAFIRARENGEGEMIRYYLSDGKSNSKCLKMLAFRINREWEDMANEVHGE